MSKSPNSRYFAPEFIIIIIIIIINSYLASTGIDLKSFKLFKITIPILYWHFFISRKSVVSWGFQLPEIRKKIKILPDLYTWFSVCSQKYIKEKDDD